MIIKAKNLHKYLHHIEFPVEILHARSDAVAHTVDRLTLLAMIERECLFGVGSWDKLRYLRMASTDTPKLNLQARMRAADSSTTTTRTLESGHRVVEFHAARCSAYADGRDAISEYCV